MKKLMLLAGMLLLSGTVLAGSCPRDMRAIDDALAKSPMLSEADMKMVKDLRAEGERLHKAGQHGDSVAALHKGMEILGIK